MKDLNTQIAQFAFPFPAKIFEKELDDSGIQFRSEFIPSTEAMGSHIYYIRNEDFDRAFIIKNKIEKEEAEYEIKNRHPFVKVLPYMAFILFVLYAVFKYVLDKL